MDLNNGATCSARACSGSADLLVILGYAPHLEHHGKLFISIARKQQLCADGTGLSPLRNA